MKAKSVFVAAMMLLVAACTTVGTEDAASEPTTEPTPATTALTSQPDDDSPAMGESEPKTPVEIEAPGPAVVADKEAPPTEPPTTTEAPDSAGAPPATSEDGVSTDEEPEVIASLAGPIGGTVQIEYGGSTSPVVVILPSGVDSAALDFVAVATADPSPEEDDPILYIWNCGGGDPAGDVWDFDFGASLTSSHNCDFTLASNENEASFTVSVTAHAIAAPLLVGTPATIPVLIQRSSPITP